MKKAELGIREGRKIFVKREMEDNTEGELQEEDLKHT
jgi:hypothetical protein